MPPTRQRRTDLRQDRSVTSVRHTAYDKFQQALLQGKLRPGQILSQKDLVALLGLSIGALRELLPRLQAEGLLNVMPQRGIQITVVDLPMIRDAFQLRVALEREAVITATQTLSKAILLEQRDLHVDIRERVARGLSEDLLAEGQIIDTKFHDLLIGATENELLIQAYHVNFIRIRLIKLDRILLTETTFPSAFNDHLAIIDAMLERDPQKAAAAMEHHIRNARDRAVKL